MEIEGFRVRRLADIMLYQLTPAEQEAVRASVRRLVGVPPAEWLARGARRLADDRFALAAGPNLRVVLGVVPGGPPEVIDIVRQELIDELAGAGAHR
jgi:hypothetical protein